MKNNQLSFALVSVKFCLLFFLLFLPLISIAQLGKYEFTGRPTGDNQFNWVTIQPSHATFSNFKRVGVNYTYGDYVYNTRSWKAGTIDYSVYLEFTITAQPQYNLFLEQLQFESSRSNEGPTRVRVAHNASGNFITDYIDFVPNTTNLQKTTWDFPDIKTALGGSVTFRIYGVMAQDGRGAYKVDNVSLFGSVIPHIYINEFHYANTAETNTGFVEVKIPKDFTALNTAALSLYNSAGKVYASYSLDKFKFLTHTVYGDYKIIYLDLPDGLAESSGGISLSSGSHLIQFLSYGGAITGQDGPAVQITSEDVGLTENAEDGAYHSLALMPNLSRMIVNDSEAAGTSDEIWEKGEVNNNTKGYDNSEPYQPLPVSLVFFRATNKPEGVLFNWATASELNNKGFTLERSSDNINYKAVGTVNGYGTTLEQQQYTLLDKTPLPGTSYYRLKQTDLDGTTTYSPVLAVTRSDIPTTLSLFPNPAATVIHVEVGTLASTREILLQVLNLQGQIQVQRLFSVQNNRQDLTLPIQNLPTGTYYLVVIKDGVRQVKPFLKQ